MQYDPRIRFISEVLRLAPTHESEEMTMKHDVGIQISIKPDDNHDWVLFASYHERNETMKFVFGVGHEERPIRIGLTIDETFILFRFLQLHIFGSSDVPALSVPDDPITQEAFDKWFKSRATPGEV